MELTTRVEEILEYKWGTSTDEVVAGQALKIETTPNGEEILNAVCPEGKVWTIRIDVYIDVTDA